MSLIQRNFGALSDQAGRLHVMLSMSMAGHPLGRFIPNPFLQGGFAPVPDEISVDDLPVRGAIPAELNGVYLRNGPNPAYKPISYLFPFDGDGMLHALRLRDGKAAYRNRFVVTAGLRAERRAGRALYGGMATIRPVDPALIGPDGDPNPIKNTANTNVVRHAGRVFALWEGGPPTELDAGLQTIGPCDFGGKLPGSFTAHPKTDPATGEMLAFRYAGCAPYLMFSVIDAAGSLVREVALKMDAGFMVHDFAITAHHAVFFLCPVVVDIEAAMRGGRALDWQPARGTRIAVLPRQGDGPVRWFDADPFFVFHFMNAHERDGGIAVDYIQHAGFGPVPGPAPSLWRMDLDLATGTARRTRLHDRSAEFPRIDPSVEGRPNRYGWSLVRGAVRGRPGTFTALGRYDLSGGDLAIHDFGRGQEVDEPVFIPRPGGTAEGDGWIGAYVYDHASDASRFVLLDAIDIQAPPIAEISLPRRVPHGFHGNWMAE
jgi:carotenoid cleavage dioxygenase